MRSPVVPLLPLPFLVFRSPFPLTFLDPQQGKVLLLRETILEDDGGKLERTNLNDLQNERSGDGLPATQLVISVTDKAVKGQ